MPVVKSGVIVDSATVTGKLDEVFEFMGDFSNSVKWDPGVKSATPDQQGKVKVGSSFTLVTVFNGEESLMTYEVSKWEPPHAAAAAAEGTDGAGPRTAMVELKGDGAKIRALDTMIFTEQGDTVKIDYTADLSLKSFRRPFIVLISTSLDKLGKDAMSGIENFYKHGNKLGADVAAGDAK